MKTTELGCAGHLIVSSRCRWHRHTQIGTTFRVSTVGEYYPEKNGPRETVGGSPDAFFETMVFATTDQPDSKNDNCGCLAVASWQELFCNRYATAGEAQSGHEGTVKRFKRKVPA